MMPLHVQRRRRALLPRLQADEDRAEVRLVGAGDDAVAADRLVGLDAVRLAEDLPRPCASTALVRSSEDAGRQL